VVVSTPPSDGDDSADGTDSADGDDSTGSDTQPPAADATDEPADNTPTVSCERCGRTWTLDYELDALYAGNQAFEQFAIDHERHTGHFPDGVTPWAVDCRQCPDGERFLDERPARRWAETHARHTRHAVELSHSETETVVEPDAEAIRSASTAESESED
jgi:hypothetical protein